MYCFQDDGIVFVAMEDSPEQKIRLFMGVALSERARGFVAGLVQGISGSLEGVRWIPAENLHVTLKFLGSTETGLIPEIISVMKEAATGLPVELLIGGIGGFPSQGSARIVYVDAEDPTGGIVELQGGLERGMEKYGYGREKRRYQPHVTVGRARKKPVRLHDDLPVDTEERVPLKVQGITLYRSVLKRTGAEYSILETVYPDEIRH